MVIIIDLAVMPDVREERSKSIGRMFDLNSIDRNSDDAILIDGIPVVGSLVNQDRSLLEEQKEWAMRDRILVKVHLVQ